MDEPIMIVKDRILYSDGWRFFIEVPIDGDDPVRVEATEEYFVEVLKVDPLDRFARSEALKKAIERLGDTLGTCAGVDVDGRRVYILG